MKGIFGLTNSADLYNKLEWEYYSLKKEPQNPYHAYNFFVTAWHLLEWKYPDNIKVRKEVKEANPILKICEHIAVGAKHFAPKNPNLESVEGSTISGVWGGGICAQGTWEEGVWAEWLEVSLTGDAQHLFGDTIKAHELAVHVMEFWKNQL